MLTVKKYVLLISLCLIAHTAQAQFINQQPPAPEAKESVVFKNQNEPSTQPQTPPQKQPRPQIQNEPIRLFNNGDIKIIAIVTSPQVIIMRLNQILAPNLCKSKFEGTSNKA